MEVIVLITIFLIGYFFFGMSALLVMFPLFILLGVVGL